MKKLVIAALLFFYVLALIFIYGAEFSFLLKRSTGEQIEEREEVKEALEITPPMGDEV